MPFSSAQISQAFMTQNAMFGGMQAYSQQLNYPLQAGLNGGNPGLAAPPPPPPPMTISMAASSGAVGVYGEQVAGRAAGMAQTAVGLGTAAAGIGLGMAGLDPIGMGMTAGMSVGGMGGMAVGGAVAMGAALPMYAASKAIDVYGGAFTQGMHQQTALNTTLRQNFQHFGGQGQMGRGFNQQQMGQIGGMLGQEMRNNPMANAGELNSLIAEGAQMGQFTGARDVQEFASKFRQMLDTLKTVQRELGGSLTDALEFTRGAQQSGIFQTGDQLRFATGMRGTEATTGLDRDQLGQLTQQGAAMSQAVGGRRSQGAFGALRTASTLGAAIQSGAINQEAVSEATGGLTGGAALQQLTSQLMRDNARSSRGGQGRYGLFALSNAEGTGFDEDAARRMAAGDMTPGQTRRAAHRNVAGMGRAQAVNNEGQLRGAAMEQGLGFQLGQMRQRLGERVMSQSNDVASLYMQRRMHISRPQADIYMSLMRNQGSIAEQEQMDQSSASRQASLTQDVQQNRSVDSFMRNMGHEVENRAGVTKAREMGRNLVNRVSSLVERAMNDVMGVAENSVSSSDRSALNRMAMGTASADDFDAIGFGGGAGQSSGGQAVGGAGLFQGGMLQSGRTPGEVLNLRGINARGLSAHGVRREVAAATSARQGVLTMERDRTAMSIMEQDPDRVSAQLVRAQSLAMGRGDASGFYGEMKMGGKNMTANALDAYMQRHDFANPGATLTPGSLMRRGGGGVTGENLMQTAGAVFEGSGQAFMAGTAMGAPTGVLAPLVGAGAVALNAVGNLGRAAYGLASGQSVGQTGDDLGLDALSAMGTERGRATAFLAQGGDTAQHMRKQGAHNATDFVSGIRRTGPVRALRNSLGIRTNAERPQDLMLAMMEGVDTESMSAISDNADVQRDLRGILGADTEGEASARTGVLRDRILGMEDGGQRQAGLSMLQQLRGGKNGEMSDVTRAALGTISRGGSRRQLQMREELNNIGSGFSGIGRSLQAAGFGGEGDDAGLGTLARRIGQGYMGHGSIANDADGIMTAQAAFTQELAGMDTSSAEYGRVVDAIGDEESGRQQLTRASNVRGLTRELRGRGRGGRGFTRRSNQALMSRLSGGNFEDMEFSEDLHLRGTAAQRGAQVQRIMQSGSEEDRASIAATFTQNLRSQGYGEGAGEMINREMRVVEGGITEEEAGGMANRLSSDQNLQKVQREQLRAQQERANPLDTHRNTVLDAINTNIAAIAARDNNEPER